MKLLLCTFNKNKIKEIKRAFKKSPVSIITLFDLKDNEEVSESGLTFEENALIKAKHYGLKHQMMSLGDDTGLQVDYLDGGPGVFTNRYERTVELRNKKLLKELKNVTNRNAQFKTVMCLYDPFKEKEYYFTGVLEGSISNRPIGTLGFGYDPIFFVEEKGKTMGELSLEEKNEISHRGKAINLLKEFLNENINNIWYS